MLVNVKSFKILNDLAITKLAILAFLYYGENVSNGLVAHLARNFILKYRYV